jgi:hypothetical protein
VSDPKRPTGVAGAPRRRQLECHDRRAAWPTPCAGLATVFSLTPLSRPPDTLFQPGEARHRHPGPAGIGPTGPAREGSRPGDGDRRATPKSKFLSPPTGPSN